MRAEKDNTTKILAEIDVAHGEGHHIGEESGHKRNAERPATHNGTTHVSYRVGKGDLVLANDMDQQIVNLTRAITHPREDLRLCYARLGLRHRSRSEQVRTLLYSVRDGAVIVTPISEDKAGIVGLCERKHLAERVCFVHLVSFFTR